MKNAYEIERRNPARLAEIRALERYVDGAVKVDAEGAITKIRFDDRFEPNVAIRLIRLYESVFAGRRALA